MRKLWKGALFGGLAVLVPIPAYAVCEEDDAVAAKVELVLDSSGSMEEPDASGTPRINAAKGALKSVIDQMPDEAEVGMRVFGAKVFSRSDSGACTDSQQVVPVGPVDKQALRQAVDSYEPFGETPIAYALREAANDLGSEGKRSIVLVSDGEETCDEDPAAVAREIRESGVNLTVDVVGFNVSGAAKNKLQQIADNGGGLYFDAGNEQELTDVLGQTASRPFRAFTIAGTPVQGTTQPNGAPELTAGEYTDKLGPEDDVSGMRYYTLDVEPGSTVHASVTMRPQSDGTSVRSEILDFAIYPPGGDDHCVYGRTAKVDVKGGERAVLAGGIFHGPDGTSNQFDPDEACLTSDKLILEVARGDRDNDRSESPDPPLEPIEISIVEEPPVTNQSQLPPRTKKDDVRTDAVLSGSVQDEVKGGASFNQAPELTTGTWQDTIQPGEQLFYRVRADWGQAPAVSFDIAPNPGADVSRNAVAADMRVYGPDRTEASDHNAPGGNLASSWNSEQNLALNAGLPQVRYRNREGADQLSAGSTAGYYYFSLAMSDTGTCWETDLEINVAVDGEVQGAPAYVEPEPEPTQEQTDSDGGETQPQSPDPEETQAAGDDSGASDTTRPVAADGSGSDMTPILIGAGVGLLVILVVGLPLVLSRITRQRP